MEFNHPQENDDSQKIVEQPIIESEIPPPVLQVTEEAIEENKIIEDYNKGFRPPVQQNRPPPPRGPPGSLNPNNSQIRRPGPPPNVPKRPHIKGRHVNMAHYE